MSFVEAFAARHRAAQEAFNEADFETAFAGLAPDVEWHVLQSALETGVIKGRDAVVRYFAGVRDGFDWSVEAQDYTDAGEGRVIIHQRGTGAGRTTKISDSFDFWQIWEVREDGLVAHVREFEQREDAFRAVGLEP